MEWYLKVVRDNYANFNGRARRKEYWMFVLFNIIISAILLAIGFGVLYATESSLGLIPYQIYSVGIIIPSLAVLVRRMKDQDKSPWLLLLGFIPLLGQIAVIVFLCTEGTQGSNKYGPDSKVDQSIFQ